MSHSAPNSSDEILERNSKYAVNHPGSYRYVAENFLNTIRTVIVTCMDQRVVPEEFCGLSTSSNSFQYFIRCAGGRARFAVNDIVVLNSLIGINEIVLIHHTDCGLTHKSTDYVREKIEGISALEAKKIDFEDLDIKDFEVSMKNDERREQNRKAQQRFRQRRKVVDNQQENRVKLLEDAFHETLSLYISLSDMVIGIDAFSKEYPHVLKDLQRSTARILEIAKRVDHFGEISINGFAKPHIEAEAKEKELRTIISESTSAELSSSFSDNREPNPARLTIIEANTLSNSSMQQTIGLDETSRINQWTTKYGLSLPASVRGSLGFQYQPNHQPPSPQCEQLMQKLNCFACKLVQATLSHAYSVLFASESVFSEAVHRTFGSTLRIRSREKILYDLRWLLGPGQPCLPHASGYLWKQASQNDAPCAGQSLLHDVCLEVDSDAEINYQAAIYQPKLLTVLGVVQELANLRARVIDNDTFEITLDEQRSFHPVESKIPAESGVEDPAVSSPCHGYFSDSSTRLLKLRLSVPRLTVHLALAGTCAKIGPVYSRNDIAKAVEAAIIIVSSGL
ncbi:hypothetical protein GGI43DRAFT_433944 [Trichoderma evansii]